MNTINKSLIPQIVMGDKVYCTDEAARLGLELSQTITETDGTTLLTAEKAAAVLTAFGM